MFRVARGADRGRGRRPCSLGREQVLAEPGERGVEHVGRLPLQEVPAPAQHERPDALGEGDAAPVGERGRHARGRRRRRARASAPGTARRGGARPPSPALPNAALVDAPARAQRVGVGEGLGHELDVLGREVPGRGPEPVAVHGRDPRAAALRGVELGDQRVGLGALADEVVGGERARSRSPSGGMPAASRSSGRRGTSVLKKHTAHEAGVDAARGRSRRRRRGRRRRARSGRGRARRGRARRGRWRTRRRRRSRRRRGPSRRSRAGRGRSPRSRPRRAAPMLRHQMRFVSG